MIANALKKPALLAAALATALATCIGLALACPAYAEESASSDDVWSPSVTVATDKAAYAADERIVVTATAVNDLDRHALETAPEGEAERVEGLEELAADMDVTIAVPDGYAVVEGNSRASASDVMPSEKVTTRAVLAKTAAAKASSSTSSSAAKTGDAPWVYAFTALAVIAAIVLAIAALRRHGRRRAGTRMLSCLIALVLVAGLAPWAPASAHAAEADEHPEHIGRGSATFTVAGESVTVSAAVVGEHSEVDSGFDEIPDGYGQPDPTAPEDRTPKVEVVMADAQVQAAGAGAYDVVTTMKVRIHQGEGAIDLNAGTVALEDAYNVKTGALDRAYQGSIAVTGADTITATERFTVGGDDDLVWNDSNPESELIWQAISELKSHAVAIGGDAVKDVDGNVVEVPALRPFDGRGQNVQAVSTQSAELPAANGQINLTTQAESSDETATEALEAADKLLEAIGQFVDAAVKDDVGDAIQGAGSILGVIAKGITVISGTSGVSYDMIDVVERLDSISSSIENLSRQVDQISTQLDAIEHRTEFTMTGAEVANLVTTGLRYKDYVTGAMDALDRAGITSQDTTTTQAFSVAVASPQPAAGTADGNTLVAAQLVAQDGSDTAAQIKAAFNALSDKDKSTLKSLANQTKYAVGSYGASAYETAIKLADKATATTWGMDSIYKAYSKYVGSYLNWEPETYGLVKAYTAELNLSFYYAYTAAMNELDVEIATSNETDNVATDLILRKQLMEAADKVCTVNESTDVKALMEPRSDGKVRNLVTDTLFEPYASDNAHGFADHAFTARLDLARAGRVNQWIPRDFNLDNTSNFPVQRYESAISRAQFEAMFDRLKVVRTIDGYSDATSLRAEMELMGLLPSGYSPDGFGSNTNWDEYERESEYESWIWWFSKNSVNTEGDKSLPLKIRQESQSCNYFYVSSDDNPQKVKDKASAEHIRDFTGTAVNIAATSKNDLVKNVLLYRLDEKYITGHGWHLYVTYHPLGWAVSSGQ